MRLAVKLAASRLRQAAGLLLAGAHEHRHLGQPRLERGAVAPLAVDELELAVALAGPPEQRLQHPDLADRGRHPVIAASSKRSRGLKPSRTTIALSGTVRTSRLGPVAAKLYVVTDGPPTPDTRAWFDLWWNEARVVAESHRLQLHPAWINAESADLRLLDDLVEMRGPL